jgi:hypothetical protein
MSKLTLMTEGDKHVVVTRPRLSTALTPSRG